MLTKERKIEIKKFLVAKGGLTPLHTKHPKRVMDWIKVLESDKYAQCAGVLREYDDRYCCLGVACDVSSVSLGIKWSVCNSVITFDGEEVLLPSKVQDYFDLKQNPQIAKRVHLTELNDRYEFNFEEIAYVLRLSLKAGKK